MRHNLRFDAQPESPTDTRVKDRPKLAPEDVKRLTVTQRNNRASELLRQRPPSC